MNWFKIYKETTFEIEFLKTRVADLSHEYNFWHRNCFSAGRKPIAPLDLSLMRIDKILEDVREYEYLIRVKENTLKQMDKQLVELGDKEREVVRLNEFGGMTHEQIAEKWECSVDWIKQLSARAKKRLVV